MTDREKKLVEIGYILAGNEPALRLEARDMLASLLGLTPLDADCFLAEIRGE